MSGNLAVSTINGVDISVSPVATESKVIGVNQTWQDVTASRVSGTTYTNNTGKPVCIQVTVYGTNTRETATVNINSTGDFRFIDNINTAGGEWGANSIIVPANQTYKVTITSGSLAQWLELR